MKNRIFASMLCAGLLLFAVTGCGLKTNKADTSPSGSPGPSSSPTVSTPAKMTTIIGTVTGINDNAITMDLLQPYDSQSQGGSTSVGGADSSTSASGTLSSSPSTSGGSSSSVSVSGGPSASPASDGTSSGGTASDGTSSGGSTGNSSAPQTIIANGSLVYSLTGATQTVTMTAGTAVILEHQGYSAGSLSSISVGDFLAVIYSGNTVVTVIDNGPSDTVSDPSSLSGGTTGMGSSEGSPTTGGTGTASPAPSSSGSSTSGSPSSAVSYIVTTDDLKIRSGPGTTYSLLGTLAKGTKISGTVSNGWLKTTYQGKTAYVSADYLSLDTTGGGSQTTLGVPDNSKSATYITTIDDLKARSGPGTSYSILGTIPKGSKVTGTVSGGWLKSTYQGKTAYYSATYLTAAAAG